MADPLFTIPAERLPPGFADTIDTPVTSPADPQPAATVVLSRDGAEGMEVLLLKRHRSSGFVPGAYVFPGGRTDSADVDPVLARRSTPPAQGDVPAQYWFGAVREVFEETGVLLARDANDWVADTTSSERVEEWRLKLMSDQAHLLDVLEGLGARVVFDDVAYFAHWITPVVEPRRYDTRFFFAALPEGRVIRPDAREMVDAVWLTPREALARFERAQLPMVFPTVKTLQDLSQFDSVADALRTLRAREVEPILPRLVKTGVGVGIVIDP